MTPIERIEAVNALLVAKGFHLLDDEQRALLLQPNPDRVEIRGMFEQFASRLGVECEDLNPFPKLPTPAGWSVISTGGGCEAWHRRTGNLMWLLTDECEVPLDGDAAVLLGLYAGEAEEQLCFWECSCVAEALAIADGAKPI